MTTDIPQLACVRGQGHLNARSGQARRPGATVSGSSEQLKRMREFRRQHHDDPVDALVDKVQLAALRRLAHNIPHDPPRPNRILTPGADIAHVAEQHVFLPMQQIVGLSAVVNLGGGSSCLADHPNCRSSGELFHRQVTAADSPISDIHTGRGEKKYFAIAAIRPASERSFTLPGKSDQTGDTCCPQHYSACCTDPQCIAVPRLTEVTVLARIAVVVLITLLAGPVPAQEVIPEDFPLDIATPPGRGFDPVPPDDFLREAQTIADWISANSPYGETVSLPAFVLLPRATLNYIFFSQMVGGYQGQDCINALYVPHIMLLAEDFEVAACRDTLVHELVHHFQFITGAAFRCTAEAEREAYELQAQWSRETGVGLPPSPVFLRRLTCDNPHDNSR